MTERGGNSNSSHQPTGENTIHPYETVITVMGTGGSGNNAITYLKRKGTKVIRTVAVNTDAQDLLETHSDRKVLIGKNLTGGLGAGGDPEIGERAAEESKNLLAVALEGTDMLFLVCGLGGGTGTGSAPVIGKLARELGILSVAIVTMPFTEEGIIRWENAQIGLEKLRKNVDTLTVLENNKLMELFPDHPLEEAFKEGNTILTNALIGLSDLVLKKGVINLDFADVSVVMKDGPNAMIGVGESNSENRIEEAVRRAVSHPMMTRDVRGAQSVLIHVMSGPTISLKEIRKVIQNVSEMLDPNARIVWGATVDKNLGETLRVMLILSGIKEEELREGEDRGVVSEDEFATEEFKETSCWSDQTPFSDRRTIFDIKESILSSSTEIPTQKKEIKPITQTTLLFYKIFEEETAGDLGQFNRAMHSLRKNPANRRALLDSRKACKLLQASAQMFGFDEIGQLLRSVEEILDCAQSGELHLSSKVLDSITLAIEMIMDLLENRSDGQGESGYIVDRLRELKEGQIEPSNSNESARTY